MGDFNAKVGPGRRTETVTNYGLGVGNPRGNRLIHTFLPEVHYSKHALPRHLYTWISNPDKRNRNQIDYLNSIKSVKTYLIAYINYDHHLLLTTYYLQNKCLIVKECHPKRRSVNIDP